MRNLGRTIKTYVKVEVEFYAKGIMRPRGILWEDGQYFEIEKVLDIRSCPAANAGGQGDRYTIRLGEQTASYFWSITLTMAAMCWDAGSWNVSKCNDYTLQKFHIRKVGNGNE